MLLRPSVLPLREHLANNLVCGVGILPSQRVVPVSPNTFHPALCLFQVAGTLQTETEVSDSL